MSENTYTPTQAQLQAQALRARIARAQTLREQIASLTQELDQLSMTASASIPASISDPHQLQCWQCGRFGHYARACRQPSPVQPPPPLSARAPPPSRDSHRYSSHPHTPLRQGRRRERCRAPVHARPYGPGCRLPIQSCPWQQHRMWHRARGANVDATPCPHHPARLQSLCGCAAPAY